MLLVESGFLCGSMFIFFRIFEFLSVIFTNRNSLKITARSFVARFDEILNLSRIEGKIKKKKK